MSAMAYKYREELVGKRFLSVSGPGKLKLGKISEWEWRAGIVRASSHRDLKNHELTILVEFDKIEWKRREWIRVYDENVFQVFAIENTLVWAPRKNPHPLSSKSSTLPWPCLNYKLLIDKVGLSENKVKPVEFLVHKDLLYVDYADLKLYQDSDESTNNNSPCLNFPEVSKCVRRWCEFQDGQRILLTTPSVLVGYRVEVYRAEGTTQWYTAVIVSYNENTRELTLTDDTVLEEHNEDPCLVQMRLIGDGVVESILRGENIGITPRRRTCTSHNQQQLGHYTRTRSQTPSHHHHQTVCNRGGTVPTTTTNSRKSRSITVPSDSDKDREKHFREKKLKGTVNVDRESSPILTTDDTLKKKTARKKYKLERLRSDYDSEDEEGDDDSVYVDVRKASRRKSNHVGKSHREELGETTSSPSEESNHSLDQVVARDLDETHRNIDGSSEFLNNSLEKDDKNKSKVCDSRVSAEDKEVFGAPRQQEVSSPPKLGAGDLESPEDTPSLCIRQCSVILGDSKPVNQESPVGTEEEDTSCEKLAIEAAERTSVSQKVVTDSIGAAEDGKDHSSVSKLSVAVSVEEEAQNERGECKKQRTSVDGDSVPSLISSTKSEKETPTSSSEHFDPQHSSESFESVKQERRTPKEHQQQDVIVSESHSSASEKSEQVKKDLASTRPLVLNKNEPVKIWRDPKLVNSDGSVFHISSVQHSMMAHPPGATHTSYTGASAPFPSNVTSSSQQQQQQQQQQQHSRVAAAAALASQYPTHLPTGAHPSLPHIPSSAAAAYLEQQQQQHALRLTGNPSAASASIGVPSSTQQPPYHPTHHLMPQHSHLMSQYQALHNIDMMWQQQQKYSQGPPAGYMIQQYPEDHILDRERVMMQERDRQVRMERDRREQADREQRERLEREKLEKDRQERERREQEKLEKDKKERQKELLKERDRREQEKMKMFMERNRVLMQQDRPVDGVNRTVQAHFEESLRLASQKHAMGVPSWNIANLSSPHRSMPAEGPATGSNIPSSQAMVEGRRSVSRGGSSNIASNDLGQHHATSHHGVSKHAGGESEMKDGRHLGPEAAYLSMSTSEIAHHQHQHHKSLQDGEKWSGAAQRQEVHRHQQQSEMQQRTATSRSRSASGRHKAEPYPASVAPVHLQNYPTQSKGGSGNGSSSSVSVKAEPCFNLYGYQPFQHSYIMHDRRGSGAPTVVTTASETHKVSHHHSQDLIASSTGGLVHSTQTMAVSAAASHQRRPVRCTPPPMASYSEHDKRMMAAHGSVIVSGEALRHGDSSSKHHQHQSSKVVVGHSEQRSNSGYSTHVSGSTAFRPYEYPHHGQGPLPGEGLANRGTVMSSQHHLHKFVGEHYGLQPPPRSSPSALTSAIATTGGPSYSTHVYTSASSCMSSMPVTTAVLPPQAHAASKTVPSSYSSNLIQQGLVPNPMYNQIPSGARSISGGSSPASIKSTGSSAGKPVSPPGIALPLPTAQSSSLPYAKASIVAGTPRISQPPVAMPYSRQTPPPAHGGRGNPSELCRPPSVPSRSSVPTPPSRTATPGQASHPVERGRAGTPSSGLSPHLQMGLPYSGLSSVLQPQSLPNTHSPHQVSPHVPSPLPLTTVGGVYSHPRSSPASAVDRLVSPPQTQPLDLQAPDRNRDDPSPSAKRRSPKEQSTRKRQKTLSPQPMGVANEGLALAVASAHQMMSSGNGPIAARVSAPSPLVVGATAAITTMVNTAAIDTLAQCSNVIDNSHRPQSPVHNSSSASVVQPVITSPNRDTGFMNSFRSFVHSTQQQQQQQQQTNQKESQDYHAYQYGKHKGKHKAAKQMQQLSSSTTSAVPTASSPNTVVTSSVLPSRVVTSSPALSNGPTEPEKAISPALSTGSASTCSNPTPKLKKEWLIRHSNEDCRSVKSDTSDGFSTVASSVASSAPVSQVSAKGNSSNSTGVVATASQRPEGKGTKIASASVSSLSTSVNGHSTTASKKSSMVFDNLTSTDDSDTCSAISVAPPPKRTPKRKKAKSAKKKSSAKDSKRHKNSQESRSEKLSRHQQEKLKDLDEEEYLPKGGTAQPKKRGRKPKAKPGRAEAVRKSKSGKSCKRGHNASVSERPSLARLKRTGEAFLQKGPCYEVAPKLSKCRECRLRPKKATNIFCRFYEFRRLRYSKNGFLINAGFSEPKDANEDDLRLWMPPKDDPPSDLEMDTGKVIVNHIGDQFCDLVEQEREAQAMHMSEDKTIAWKRVVQGVREMCDVCETTLFNIHWACGKCGFVVCIDCYKARQNGTVKEEENPTKDQDEFSWLLCNNRQPHEQEKLMLTQIIAGNALWDMGKMVHDVRKKWSIPNYCSCGRADPEPENNKKTTVNGICKQLMSAVTKCFGPDSVSEPSNGGSDAIRSPKKLKSHNGSVEYIKQEGVSGYNPETSSPLSWLADVALNSSSKLSTAEDNSRDAIERVKEKLSLSDGSDPEDSKNSENYSTLRELLIRPTSKNGGSVKNNGAPTGHKRKLGTLDEVISHVIEQSVGRTDKGVVNKEEMKLLHYLKRYPQPRSGHNLLPIRIFTLEESKLLYPIVPHAWLCNGRLLRLLDPYHKGNIQLFQEQWKRGQPILVSEVNKSLDMSLWHPEAFARDFGDIKNDLVNCSTGNIVPNQPMRKFWEGFETFAKRMKDENGVFMLLKLKDWPPGDDFSEMLPSRFQDLMKALPLPEYTHRNGLLNMAGRLPECFVRPDLGPKMYNAYGSAMYPDKGTTNLHLDISDAVNVMVYVGIPKDANDELHIQEALKAIEEGGCDSLTLRRVREKGQKPGALWHIYHARDADKIRDLLNKVAVERGEKLEPHHDPIHDQSWYLDGPLRERLYKEYCVEGYAIAQCLGDSVFIPAGAPHQVRNLHSCIKVAEDFVSPENISHCFTLTQEFRHLSDTHTNHEDKLQVKNIIYHAIRDALALLMINEPDGCVKPVKNK